jgi:hypothetical protein
MSVLHEERQLSAEQRRALKLLADAGEQGCTGPNLFNLVSHGLATGTSRNRESELPKDQGGSHPDYGRLPAGARRLIEFGPGTRRCGPRWIPTCGWLTSLTRRISEIRMSLAARKGPRRVAEAIWRKCKERRVARHRTPRLNGRQRLLLLRFTYVNDRVQQASERIQPGALNRDSKIDHEAVD